MPGKNASSGSAGPPIFFLDAEGRGGTTALALATVENDADTVRRLLKEVSARCSYADETRTGNGRFPALPPRWFPSISNGEEQHGVISAALVFFVRRSFIAGKESSCQTCWGYYLLPLFLSLVLSLLNYGRFSDVTVRDVIHHI